MTNHLRPSNSLSSSPTIQPRRGSILVCVIVCISIATALVAAMTRSALRNHRQIRVDQQLRQVELLVEAAGRRAVAKLTLSPSYTGETWVLAPETLPSFPSAQVEIKVSSARDASRRIRLIAILPANADRPVRRSDEFVFRLPDAIQSPTPNEE